MPYFKLFLNNLNGTDWYNSGCKNRQKKQRAATFGGFEM